MKIKPILRLVFIALAILTSVPWAMYAEVSAQAHSATLADSASFLQKETNNDIILAPNEDGQSSFIQKYNGTTTKLAGVQVDAENASAAGPQANPVSLQWKAVRGTANEPELPQARLPECNEANRGRMYMMYDIVDTRSVRDVLVWCAKYTEESTKGYRWYRMTAASSVVRE